MSTLTESLPKEVTEDVLNEKSNAGEPAQPQPQLSTAIPKMTSLAWPSAVHNMTATTLEVAAAQKRKRPSCRSLMSAILTFISYSECTVGTGYAGNPKNNHYISPQFATETMCITKRSYDKSLCKGINVRIQ